LLLVAGGAAGAQRSTSPVPTEGKARQFMDDCSHRWGGDDREHFCDVRDVTIPATHSLDIDGDRNGSVTVHGSDRTDVRVVSMIDASAEDRAGAERLGGEVKVRTDGGRIHADTPDELRRHESVSVSYEIWLPRATDLDVEAENGGISLDSVTSHVRLQTTNGSVRLRDVGGDVHGGTTNGSVGVDLSGDRWNGEGLDLRTTNGSVRLTLPANYSAHLTTGTVNGGMNIDFPITVQGRINREISTDIGHGGPPIRVVTTNGGVSVRKQP
jgi:DUF4097 and DUF4098 domain-containing protein YvlB